MRGEFGWSSRKVIRKPDTFIEERHFEKINRGARTT